MNKNTLNLDSMTIEELSKIYKEFDSHIRITSKKYDLSVSDGKLYRAYAINKLVAMKIRISGSEYDDAPEKYESICDNLYKRMAVKW